MDSHDYAELLSKHLHTIQLEPGEQIRQCTDDSFGCAYYNPYWAVTSYGRVFSIRKNGLKELRPYLAEPKSSQIQIENHFSKKYICLSRIVCVYFTQPEHFLNFPEEYKITPDMSVKEREECFRKHWHVHHIIPRDYVNKPIGENDNISNLLPLPVTTHMLVHKIINHKKTNPILQVWDIDHTITIGNWLIRHVVWQDPEPIWDYDSVLIDDL